MEENKRGSDQSGSFSKGKTRQGPSTGLEVEAGFEVWLAFVRQHLGSSHAWDRPYTSDLEQVNATDAETLRNEDTINDEVLRRIQHDIDLAEARLQRHR